MRRRRRIAVKASAFLGVFLLLLSAVLGWNYSQFRSRQIQVDAVPKVAFDESAAVQRFAKGLQIPTIATSPAKLSNESPHYAFGDYLRNAFPALHAEPIRRYGGKEFGDPANPSILFEWPGKQAELDAILLMSHFDVVPAVNRQQETEGDGWSVPPFSGKVDENFIWGRGAIDCKHGVFGILEAINHLLSAGYQPDRTIYVALGHDEEMGGAFGNGKIGRWMREQGKRLEVVLDEGGCIFTEFPGLDRSVALVGVAEKGIVTIDLEVRLKADAMGHASMPPRDTAVSILSVAIQKIQNNPFPAELEGTTLDTLRFVGPEMSSWTSRVAMSNLWLTAPLVKRMLGKTPSGNAMLRTTVAPTIFKVENENDNVLPQAAMATLNVRLMPGTTVQETLTRLNSVVSDDRVRVTAREPWKEASAVSPIESDAFENIHTTIRQIYPDVVVAPFVLVGSTDTIHYSDLCNNIYRFIPARLSERDTKRFHGIDERIAKQDFLDIIRFYRQFILNTTKTEL